MRCELFGFTELKIKTRFLSYFCTNKKKTFSDLSVMKQTLNCQSKEDFDVVS